MIDSLPLYRIVYANGYIGGARSWRLVCTRWCDGHAAACRMRKPRLAPLRVERV